MSRPIPLLPRRALAVQLLAALLVAFGSILAPLAARAAADPVYTIENVQVDITASDAATARGMAFTQAQQAAFRQLSIQLVGADAAAHMKQPDDITLSTMVKDYETTAEQLSTVRYLGTYTVRFRGPAVRGFLARQGLTAGAVSAVSVMPSATPGTTPGATSGATVAAKTAKPVLVLPFYEKDSVTTLWGADNPWLAAWLRASQASGGAPVLVPLGDAEDLSDIDGSSLGYAHASLGRLAQRYDAGDIAIVLAGPLAGGSPGSMLFTFYRTDKDTAQPTRKLTVTPMMGEDTTAFYNRAVLQVRIVLQGDWKHIVATDTVLSAAASSAPSSTMPPPVLGNETEADRAATAAAAAMANPDSAADQSGINAIPASTNGGPTDAVSRYHAHAHFSGLPEWIRTQRALRGADGVTGLHVGALSPNGADVDFSYRGSADALRISLVEAGVALTPGIAGDYDLRLLSGTSRNGMTD